MTVLLVILAILVVVFLTTGVVLAIKENKTMTPEKRAWKEIERLAQQYRRSSKYTYTGLPWMGGEKVKNKYKY